MVDPIFNGIAPAETRKSAVIVIIYGPKSSIEFSSTLTSDIYTITNPNTFLPYIEQIFAKEFQQITVVPVFSSFNDLITLLKFLSQLNVDLKNAYKQRYDEKYKQVLTEIQGIPTTTSLVYSEGQNDIPLSCNLVFVLDSGSLDPDHLSSRNLHIQQYSRFLAFKHGASILAIENIADFLLDPERIVNVNAKAKPIYGNTSSHDDFLLNLYIPIAWDSWAKILLLSKSMLHLTNCKFLTSEDDLRKLNVLYQEYFDGSNIENVLGFIEERMSV